MESCTEQPQTPESGPNPYGWTAEELKWPLVFDTDVFLDDVEQGSERKIKAQARWDDTEQKVVVRGTDGFKKVFFHIASLPKSMEDRFEEFYWPAKELWNMYNQELTSETVSDYEHQE